MKFLKNLWYGIVLTVRFAALLSLILWMLVYGSEKISKRKAPDLDRMAISSIIILLITEEDMRKRREEKAGKLDK
jgi:hypothetical protein